MRRGGEMQSHRLFGSLGAVLRAGDGEPSIAEVDTKDLIPSILPKI